MTYYHDWAMDQRRTHTQTNILDYVFRFVCCGLGKEEAGSHDKSLALYEAGRCFCLADGDDDELPVFCTCSFNGG